jgi:hypothetical protein
MCGLSGDTGMHCVWAGESVKERQRDSKERVRRTESYMYIQITQPISKGSAV